MGINKLLPLLEPMTHTLTLKGSDHYKVRSFSSANSTHTMQDLMKQNHRCSEQSGAVGESEMRYLRVGIDISTWISAACHGNGAELMDERHLSNFGRSELEQHKRDNMLRRGTSESDAKEARNQEQILKFIDVATGTVVRKIKSIQHFLSPTVLIVLDGASPPVKKDVVQSRMVQRNDAANRRDDASFNVESMTNGKQVGDDIDIIEQEANRKKISSAKKAGASTSHLYSLIVTSILHILRQDQIPFMVAPYEADGQLTYLCNKGYIDFIVSEDSDFVAYGAEAVFYKYKVSIPYGLGLHNKEYSSDGFKDCIATAKLILKRELGACSSHSFSLLGFTDVMITMMCVAAGCDYAPSLKGIGLINARSAVSEAFCVKSARTGTKDCIERTLSGLFARCHGRLSREEKTQYSDRFIKGLVSFRHPVIFDPIVGKCVLANIDSPDVELMSCASYAKIVNDCAVLQAVVGELYDQHMAVYISEGWINPKIMELRFENETPEHISNYLYVWKQAKIDKDFQNKCDKDNSEDETGTQMEDGHTPCSISRLVSVASPVPQMLCKSRLNPSQSTAETNSVSKPSTQGSHPSNFSIDAAMSPDLLA
jgi:5'-3' exonuclease